MKLETIEGYHTIGNDSITFIHDIRDKKIITKISINNSEPVTASIFYGNVYKFKLLNLPYGKLLAKIERIIFNYNDIKNHNHKINEKPLKINMDLIMTGWLLNSKLPESYNLKGNEKFSGHPFIPGKETTTSSCNTPPPI